jgi:hypothetical protein
MYLSLLIDPLVCVRTETIHKSESIWSSSVREQNGNLMQSLWTETPEVPSHVRVLNTSFRVSLLAVNEVGELNRILDEKDWSVVSNHIEISLLSVELNCETSRISFSVSRTELTSNS